MEEIRSTEALDREILEDARKKADRILKAAEQRLESDKEDLGKKDRKRPRRVGTSTRPKGRKTPSRGNGTAPLG